jgi:cyclopropane-fatty-acyl-phospholipid synthase
MELTHKRPRTAGIPFTVSALLGRLSRIQLGSLDVEYAQGSLTLTGVGMGPTGHIRLHRPGRLLARLAGRGDIGFAEGYMAGDWDTEDLAPLLWTLAENQASLGSVSNSSRLSRLVDRVLHARNANTRRGSRRNIAFHYDLGNDFYRLWLDEGMTYSAACFEDSGQELSTAQDRKYQRLLQMVGARAGDHLLEIGCGWGGFTELAASQGMHVTGVTLSREQLAWARQRLDRAGLADRADLHLQDYRDIVGRFDHIVSVEMFEAVGEAYWPVYMQRISELLAPGGSAALQVIVISPPAFEQYRRRPDFIQRYIFPGGMLPSVPAFDQAAAAAGLRVVAREYGGLDYARTLGIWRERFHQHWPEIARLGYDERFRRMWDYYLAYCEAGFRTGRIDLMRVALRAERDA